MQEIVQPSEQTRTKEVKWVVGKVMQVVDSCILLAGGKEMLTPLTAAISQRCSLSEAGNQHPYLFQHSRLPPEPRHYSKAKLLSMKASRFVWHIQLFFMSPCCLLITQLFSPTAGAFRLILSSFAVIFSQYRACWNTHSTYAAPIEINWSCQDRSIVGLEPLTFN